MVTQSQSVTHTTDTGAMVEVGIITHEGREFSAWGSIIDHARGVVVAYIGEYTTVYENGIKKSGYRVTTWEGKQIGWAQRVSTWRQWSPGAYSPTTMTSYRAVIDGHTYAGRHGDMDLIRLKRCK